MSTNQNANDLRTRNALSSIKTPVRLGLEVSDLSDMCDLLAHLRLVDSPDFRWNKILPLKVNINTWRIIHKRVPTRSNLDYRWIDLDSVRCPICDDEIESEEHIFVMCNVVREAWKNIMLWWKINNTFVNNLNDAINLEDRVSLPTKLLKVFDVVVQITLWFLWKFRNNVVFSSKRPCEELIFNDIKLYSFVWISNRLKKSSMN
ncbi:RNA-directed DNA polymerase, eukaryota, reverse transcriptase zinc-binding domain protein [Tanacetum coccineum]|uniref:RNA-directed DNA polymerase, eukaryota, reverse transcriptase zinc-binding domain protein n=1 Tax=Tanacetum coccineum TaxID=301880 RepID=A0ABQ5EAV8_9ASTR